MLTALADVEAETYRVLTIQCWAISLVSHLIFQTTVGVRCYSIPIYSPPPTNRLREAYLPGSECEAWLHRVQALKPDKCWKKCASELGFPNLNLCKDRGGPGGGRAVKCTFSFSMVGLGQRLCVSEELPGMSMPLVRSRQSQLTGGIRVSPYNCRNSKTCAYPVQLEQLMLLCV